MPAGSRNSEALIKLLRGSSDFSFLSKHPLKTFSETLAQGGYSPNYLVLQDLKTKLRKLQRLEQIKLQLKEFDD